MGKKTQAETKTRKLNKKNLIWSLVAFVLLIAIIASVYFFWGRGYLITKTAEKTVATATVEAPSDSYIYHAEVNPSSVRISYDNPVARVNLANEEITSGVSIYPDTRGRWYFSGDRNIHFTPEKDWIPNTKYTIKLAKEIFSPEIVIKDAEFTFTSPEFRGSVDSSNFYEDPTDTKKKHVVATFSFNYPIDSVDLKKYVQVKTMGGDKYDFDVNMDKDYINKFHVISSPVKIKTNEDFAEITVSGTKNAYNNERMKNNVSAKIKIPSSSTFFKVTSINTGIVKNENKNNEAEQILFINFSTAVDSKELSGYIEFFYKEDHCYNFRDKLSNVYSPLEIGGVKHLPVEKVGDETAKVHTFKYDITNRYACIIAKVKKGLSSKDGFILSADEVVDLSSVNYPMEAKISFEGSILSLKGDKHLALTSRAADKLEIQVARIMSSSINHLVSQTYGDFSHPYFRGYTFDETNISEIFDQTQHINMEHPSKLNYSSVDLNPYFQGKRGIFLVKVKGSYQDQYTSQDQRLVVITDMGVIAKDNLDKTHDIFVSSFSEGKPVSGAKVELLGKNGITVLEEKTDKNGKASFPDFSDFKKDKEPVAYVVTNGADVSYIPVYKPDRRMEFSRFDIGGVYDADKEDKILGFVFSDRGIYRPGETASFGLMVRGSNLDAPLKLPLYVGVINPNGDIVSSQKFSSDSFGYLDFSYNIPSNAPVGTYSIVLHDDSTEEFTLLASTYFKVEEFTPDSMKIKLGLEDVKSKGWYKLLTLKANVNLQNLYGNPAGGHNVKARVTMDPTTFYFKEFSGYNFRDPLKDIKDTYVKFYHENLEDTNTGADGNAKFVVDLNNFAQGTYRLTVNVDGFELDSGRSVSTSSSALVSPLDYIVGYKANGSLHDIKKNSERTVSFVAIDNDLNKLNKENLTLELTAIKYVSSLMQMPNGTYKYQMVPKEELISSNSFAISDGTTPLELDTTTSGGFYYIVKDTDGRVVSKVEYSVAGSKNTNYLLDKDANLSIILDKKEYNSGDEITIKIAAPYEGYGLITIERDKTYAYKWFKTDKNTTTQTITLPEHVEGNAYINVAFIRDINSREIFIPPLSYAVAPFEINKDARTIKIDLSVPEVVKPGHDLVVKYKTSKSGRIIIYGVNQGILQVAGYKTPDPVSAFIKKKALRVTSYQTMDLIMPEMNLVLDYRAAGGDEMMEEALKSQQNPFARRQDEVVAFWSGVINADENGGEYTYRVPEIFNGQIKIMAVAVSDTGFGSASKDTYVRGDFALTPSGPFNVIPGDIFEVGTSVANLVEGSGDNYEIKISLVPSEGLEVIGDKEQIISLKEKAESSIRFKVKSTNKLGSSTLRFNAVATKDDTKSFSMPYHIGIRPATPFVTSLVMGYEPSKLKLKDFVTPMFEEYRRQEVMASTSPLVLADGLVRYLDKFPHWCTEQTISKIYPGVVMLFKHPDLVKNIDVYGLFNDAISILSERQKLDGGFSGWSGSYAQSNEYVSLYAFDFLTTASENNFNVPSGMLSKAKNYAKSVAGREMSSEDDLNVPYAIYLLTKSGEVTTNYLLNAEQYLEGNHKKTWRSTLGATYMAASYHLLKNDVKARGLLGKYKLGKDNISDARYIYLMATHFNEDFKDLGQKSVQALLDPLKSGNFTTNSASYSLLALAAYDMSNDKLIAFSGKEPGYTPFATVGVSEQDKLLEISSPQSFFYVVSEQGFVSASVDKAKSNFIEVDKQYLDKDGKEINTAKIGDEITVRIKVRTAGGRDSISDVAVTDLIAGCFEMVRDTVSSTTYLDNSEQREDRALIYLTATKSAAEITYKLKVIAKGEFVSPAVFAEALYDSDVKANSIAKTFTVEE